MEDEFTERRSRTDTPCVGNGDSRITEKEIFERNLEHFIISKRYGDKAQCRCPAHDDKRASLTITKGRKCTLFYCHAGCTVDDILPAAGLEKKDTFYDTEPQRTNWRAYIESREKRKIGFRMMECFLQAGFVNKEIIIKEQHNCRSTDYWETQNNNFLLLAHEYIFVFQK